PGFPPTGLWHRLVLFFPEPRRSALLHTLCVPYYPFAGSPFGILLSTRRPPSSRYLRLTIVQPFPGKKPPGTMASADFSQQALLHPSDFLMDVCETSPGKNDNLHSV